MFQNMSYESFQNYEKIMLLLPWNYNSLLFIVKLICIFRNLPNTMDVFL